VQTLEELYIDIAAKKKWSYYENCSFDINGKWNDNTKALYFIEKYFDFAGKSHCFKDKNLDRNRQFIEERAKHIISTFLIGIKLFECFQIETESRDENNVNLKYYWFLTCLYHDIGYAYEKHSIWEQLKMLQTDGLEAIQEIADIKYLNAREFKTFSKEEIDLYLKGRAYCSIGHRGCIDHGIVGGLLLYDKLRRQFEISWRKRTNESRSRESFNIKDECRDRTLHLSNSHYEAYAKVADAIMTHNVYWDTFNDYVEKFDTTHQIRKRTDSDKILLENHMCFILSIADTIEPLKRNLKLTDISIEALSNGIGARIAINSNAPQDAYTHNIKEMQKWINIEIPNDPVLDNGNIVLTLSLPNC